MMWIILSIILVVLILIFNLYIKICITYINEDLKLILKILFFKFTLIPMSDKKSKKKVKPKSKQPVPSKLKKKKKLTFNDVTDLISTVKQIVEKVLYYFDKYLKIDITEFRIKVASEDAASTAIIYGFVSQGVAYVMEIIRQNVKTLRVKYRDSVLVVTDFVSEKAEARIDMTFKLRIWQVIVLGIGSFKKFLLNLYK